MMTELLASKGVLLETSSFITCNCVLSILSPSPVGGKERVDQSQQLVASDDVLDEEYYMYMQGTIYFQNFA